MFAGEDRQKFKKLYADLVVKYRPDGPLEEDAIFDIAHLIFRKQNLERNRRASISLRVQQKVAGFTGSKLVAQTANREKEEPFPTGLTEHLAIAYIEATTGLENRVSLEGLLRNLAVEERLQTMIDRCFRRYAMLKTFEAVTKTIDAKPAK